MDITEIKERRNELESQIKDALRSFEDSTGTIVEEVEITRELYAIKSSGIIIVDLKLRIP